jgi:transglutaminase-like putative cysteine protease
METGPTHKSLATLGLMALVILAPATVFTVTGDAPHVLILAGLGLVVSCLLRNPLERNTRSFVYTGLIPIVLAVLAEQLLPIDPNRFFFLVPAHVLCPPLIFAAVAITFLDQRDSNVSGVVGLSLLALMVSGNCMGFQVAHRRLPMPPHAERYLLLFYGMAVAVQLTACVGLMARAPYLVRLTSVGPRRRALRFGLTFGLLALTAAGTLALRGLAKQSESFWQSALGEFIHLHHGHGGEVVFGREVDLWRTVPRRSAADHAVILHALSSRAPGYLRGRAYTQYSNGHWSANPHETGLPFVQPGGRLTYSIFKRPPPANAPPDPLASRRIDIYPSRGFRSDVLFAPGPATTFEVLADSLGHNEDGDLTPSEWEPRIGYTVVTPDAAGDEAYYGPPNAATAANDYLTLPENLRGPLATLAASVFADSTTDDYRTAIAALAHFFQRSFRYELGTAPRPDAADPILPFLLQRRSGHCELFATAAVLLLRQHGIPARYVTGLVCAERAAAGQWLARRGDAHAWAEAFDAGQGRWVVIEMTPAAGIPQGLPRSGLTTRGLGQLAFAWQYVFALMKRGAIAEGIVAAVKGLGRGLGWLILSPVGGPLTVLLALLVARRWHRRRARAQNAGELPPPRMRLRAAYVEVRASLRRRLPDVPPQPTPLVLAERVRRQLPEVANPILALALERYQSLRYGRRLPHDAEITTLQAQFRAGMRELKKAVPRGTAPGENSHCQ